MIDYGYKSDSVVWLRPPRLPDCGVDRVERTQIGPKRPAACRWQYVTDDFGQSLRPYIGGAG
jgi:hypothetical protein